MMAEWRDAEVEREGWNGGMVRWRGKGGMVGW